MGDEVYEDRYILRFKHFTFVIAFTFVLPFVVAFMVLNSFNDNVDDDFK